MTLRTHLIWSCLFAALIGCGPPEQQPESGEDDMSSSPDSGCCSAPDDMSAPAEEMSSADLDLRDEPNDLPEVTLQAHAGPSLYALVGESVTLDGSASTGAVTYQWRPGNALEPLPASSQSSVTVTYDEPGRYRASPTVTDASGKQRTDSALISITHPAIHPHNASSSIAVWPATASRAEVIVAMSEDARQLSVFERDEDTFTLRERIATQGSPRQIARHDAWIAVTTRAPEALELISLETPSIRTSFPLPAHARPHGLLSRGETLYVTLQATGALMALQLDMTTTPPTLRDLQVVPALPDARAITELPDERILVTRWRSSHQGAEAIVLNLENLDVASTWTLPVDLRPSSDTESSGVPNYLSSAVHSPTQPWLYIPSTQANIVEGLALDGVDPEHDTVLRAVVSGVDSRDGSNDLDGRVQFDGRGLASAALYSPMGDYLYVTMRGSRTVEIIDVLSGGEDAGTLFDVGFAPEALALTSDGRYLLVDATLSRELVVFDTTTIAQAPVPVHRLALVDEEPLDQALLYGKQLFGDTFDRRLTGDGYIACAHCHLEGESDHLTWDFSDRGEGLRNTTSLLGRAGAGHGPIHWSGNFDEPQDFEHDIREHFAGAGFLTDEQYATSTPLGLPKAGLSPDLDALALYMNSLDTFPPSPHARDDAAERGAQIFLSAETACATCHAGERLTDSSFLMPGMPLLHDVGTIKATSGSRLGEALTGIDTPTLHELWNSAPYLHDGSAQSLRDVLTTHNPMDSHGKTSHLSDEQIDDLVAYLLTL